MASTAGKNPFLFDDLFTVEDVNPEGKKFDKVCRLVCKSETFDVAMRIDINTDVYPMTKGDKFRFALASTLRLDGKPDDGSFDQSGMPTVLDQDEYEYCMHGKVFQYKYEKNRKVSVLASFGGLLMLLQGEQRYFATVELDASIYCLIRRVADDRAAAETALQASKERRSKK